MKIWHYSVLACALILVGCAGALSPKIVVEKHGSTRSCGKRRGAQILWNREPADLTIGVDASASQRSRGQVRIISEWNRRGARALFGFSDYEDGWRRIYCYWQVPFAFVLRPFWVVLPLAYPCYGDVTLSRDILEETLRDIAAEVGANVVVVKPTQSVPDGAIEARAWFFCIDVEDFKSGSHTQLLMQMVAEEEEE